MSRLYSLKKRPMCLVIWQDPLLYSRILPGTTHHHHHQHRLIIISDASNCRRRRRMAMPFSAMSPFSWNQTFHCLRPSPLSLFEVSHILPWLIRAIVVVVSGQDVRCTRSYSRWICIGRRRWCKQKSAHLAAHNIYRVKSILGAC